MLSMEPRAPDRAMITALFSIPRCFPAIWPAWSRARPSTFIASTSRVSSRDRPGICSSSPRLYASPSPPPLSRAGLLEGPAGHLPELAPLVRLDEPLDLLDSGFQHIRDLLLCLLGDVLVVDSRREATDHDCADGELRRLVDELPSIVRPVVPGDLVEDLSLERAHRVLVDRPGRDSPVLDHNEGVLLTEFLQSDIPFGRDRRLERHVQVLREDHR